MHLFRPLACLLLTSCIQIGSSANADAGSNGAQTSATTSATADAAGVTGTNCVDFGSGVVLCTTISLCPSVAVDHDVYPNCGFRVPSSSIDLGCICNNALCPMGSVLSCGQAQDLLASQSEIGVCAQANDGRCAALSAPTTTGGTCNKACAAECLNDALCMNLCGC